jgi:hypothetical protein
MERTMGEKLVLIDGHSILNRAFFGIPDLTNSEGLHTNAVYGFLNIMFKILEEEQPDYLTVAFDVSEPTFRHKMFAEYKGTRKPMAQELREQVPLMKEMLKAMGVTTIEKGGYEADDLLGTIAKQSEQKGFKGVEKSFAIQAGREIRIMVVPEQISDADMVLLARDISKQIEAELEYPGQIKVNVIRESRVTDYAK